MKKTSSKRAKISCNDILQNLSNIAQVVICIVAVFGYFYTVKPLYENEMLKVSLNQKEQELAALERERIQKRNETAFSALGGSFAVRLLFETSAVQINSRSPLATWGRGVYGLLSDDFKGLDLHGIILTPYEILLNQIDKFTFEPNNVVTADDYNEFKKFIKDRIADNKQYLMRVESHMQDRISLIVEEYWAKIEKCDEYYSDLINRSKETYGGEKHARELEKRLEGLNSDLYTAKVRLRAEYEEKLFEVLGERTSTVEYFFKIIK